MLPDDSNDVAAFETALLFAQPMLSKRVSDSAAAWAHDGDAHVDDLPTLTVAPAPQGSVCDVSVWHDPERARHAHNAL